MNNGQFEIVMETMKRLEKKVDLLLYEDDIVSEEPKPKSDFRDDDIYKNGQRVPYNKLNSGQMEEFKKFLYHIRMNSANYSEREVDYASFSDKDFEDIRLSDNSKRILQGAYLRTYKRDWPFKFIPGYLHKLGNEKGWSWSDGTRD